MGSREEKSHSFWREEEEGRRKDATSCQNAFDTIKAEPDGNGTG